jgi:hypothetical protein
LHHLSWSSLILHNCFLNISYGLRFSGARSNAGELLLKGCLRERTAGKPLALHSDNGSAMKGATMLAAMQELGVAA